MSKIILFILLISLVLSVATPDIREDNREQHPEDGSCLAAVDASPEWLASRPDLTCADLFRIVAEGEYK